MNIELINKLTLSAFFVLSLAGCSHVAISPKLSKISLGNDPIISAQKQDEGLKKAVEYWGKEYKRAPTNATYAYNYANNLIVSKRSQDAFRVLEQALSHNPNDKKLNSAYGRLALQLNKVQLAEKVLKRTDNIDHQDWRVLSAKGTLFARKGEYVQAQDFFSQALKISPNEPSVINNLALSHALSGAPHKAETLLRKVVDRGQSDNKIKHNLALVLSLQGKFDEAKKISKTAMSPKQAEANIKYLRQIVQNPIRENKIIKPVTIKASASADALPLPIKGTQKIKINKKTSSHSKKQKSPSL